MTKLASAADTAVYEKDGSLYILKKPAAWISTALFVTGLLSFLLLTNGMVQLLVFKKPATGLSMAGIILALSGILILLIFWRILIYRKKTASIPPDALECICIFALDTNKLLDGNENLLASLDNVYITRQMQITSSSPKLILRYGGNTITVAKGNPFSAGIGALENILISKGIRKK